MPTTISIYALPLGGIAGSATVFPDVLQRTAKILKEAEGSLLTDSFVTHVTDWLVLVMVHDQGGASPLVSALKDAAIAAAAKTAEKRRLFSRDVRPVMCGLSFAERESEPFVLFLAGSNVPSLWNFVLLSQFADPFATPSLTEGKGFVFCTEDAMMFQTPRDLHRLILAARTLAIVGVAVDVDTPAASAGFGVMMLARAEAPYPSTAELCGVFAKPSLATGKGFVFCPVSLCECGAVVSGVVPVVALGFSVSEGRLSGPVDIFDNPAFSAARAVASKFAGYFLNFS
ncbi:MAG: fructose-1,6-bisphosphatase [Methanocalculaceae archaeon]|jgi:fructose 1,6-bisphosphate aldolase/phosphatase|nr:fructose-1,6-bisphosphatase [Methanocalculaceae archaeon]